ncbi:MAG: 50S ribosomal protein L24 [bacterium]
MNKVFIKKGDTVAILAGKDNGKQGKVLHVFPQKNRVMVEGINFVKRHTRKNPQKQQIGGVITRESSIPVSRVMFVCPNCNQPTRLGRLVMDDGSKVRVCKKCEEVVDKK